jgi:hypothetical protein
LGPIKTFEKWFTVVQFKNGIMGFGIGNTAILAVAPKYLNYFNLSLDPALLCLSIEAGLTVYHNLISMAFLFVKFSNTIS